MDITVYTNPNCVQCDMTKRYLDRLEIPYSVVDLSVDQESLEMVVGMGHKSAPVVIAGDKSWSGYRIDKLKELTSEI